jgi:Sigma 54 modulation protein / S30EA ribosomal protein
MCEPRGTIVNRLLSIYDHNTQHFIFVYFISFDIQHGYSNGYIIILILIMECRPLLLVGLLVTLVSLLSTPTLAFISSPPTPFQLRSLATTEQSRSSKLLASIDEETTASSIPLVVEGKNIEITEALMEHVNKRLGGPLKKLGKNVVRECDVVLSVNRNPKVRAK